MASWKGFGRGLLNVGRNIPVVGELLPEEEVSPSSIDTGGAYYEQPSANAQQLYDQALAGSQASYSAGQIRDVDLSGADRLVGQQTTNLGTLQSAANNPQIAQAQYAAALGNARNAALGAVAASRGAGRGAARLNVASQFGANAGIHAQQQAAAVAQERQNALAAYTAALAGARGQDQALAAERAGLVLNRDVAADNAGRAAFQATHNARQGYLQTGNQAVGQQANIAEGQAGAKQSQYELAMAEQGRRAQQRSKNRQAMAGAAKQSQQMGLMGGGGAGAGGG